MTARWWRTDAVEWRAHGWQLEVRGDEIADIRHHGSPILRGVRVAVRDRGWQTVPVLVRSLKQGPETLTLHLKHAGLGALISSVLTVTARLDSISIDWAAANMVDFEACRIGLVALHPASNTGRGVVIVHTDGTQESTRFPCDVSPYQPMRDIRELRIDGGPTVSFAGDVFEMEDQRNWSDASFKTYSRPLDLPYPFTSPAGEVTRQSITLRTGQMGSHAIVPNRSILELREVGTFPAIGVEASTAPDPVPADRIASFRVVELDLTSPSWRAALRRAAADRRPLDVRLVSDGDTEQLEQAARVLAAHEVLRVTPFAAALHVSDTAIVEATRAALAAAGLDVAILGGSRSHFTELNREQHRIPRDVDGIAVNTTPLFHALDTEQLIEALPMQRLIAEQSVRIADGLPVHIGPVALRPRYNNVATTPQPSPSRWDLSEGYGTQFTGGFDERQTAPELASWVVASAAALGVPGVASLSWFETWGPRGLRDPTGPTAAYEAVEAIVELSGHPLLSSTSPDGLLWCIGARTPKSEILLVANVGRNDRRFAVRPPGGDTHEIHLNGGFWTRIIVSS